ncbi:CHAD domain-containing protein [Devosia sp.]|uniref:CHAD domain-containing protein n=1 Tax=Devosia sp. TaxID=1871048 RepID=UPI003A8F10F1
MGYRWSAKDRSIADGFLRIAREQAAKAETAARDEAGAPAERVHECRRRIKKLRALIRLVRPDFPDFAMENRRLRDIARKMAGPRDAEVAGNALKALLEWAELPPAEPVAAARDDAPDRQALAGFADEMRALIVRLDFWPVADITEKTLAKGVARTYRAARRGAREAAKDDDGELMHEWRKDAKYHALHLRLLENFAADLLASEIAVASELAELLGQHHDLVMLREALLADPESLAIDLATAPVLTAARRRQRELEPRIDSLGGQVFAEKPKALRGRFGAYLAARKPAQVEV